MILFRNLVCPALASCAGLSAANVHGMDFFPTFAAIAGSPVSKRSYLPDGDDITPLFEGRLDGLKDRPVSWYSPGYLPGKPGGPGRQSPSAVIRQEDYKLTRFFEDDRIELYNIRRDIGEMKNLADELPDTAGDLKQKLDGWRADTGAEIPPRNPNPKCGVMPILQLDWTIL